MAAYPSYNILLESSVEQESGIRDDFADSGLQRSRVLHSATYFNFRLRHNLTLTQFNSLKSTYAAAPRATYTLTYHVVSPQVTYSVLFTGPPQKVSNLGGDRYIVEVPLRGTQD